MSASTGTPERIDRNVVKVASILIVGVLAVVFDTTIVSVALHTLAHDLHTSIATIQWVTTGYLLALAVTVPISAWALGRFGGKRMWLISLVVFLAGSIGSSLAWDSSSLIGFRVVQGVGGGLMLPLMQTLIIRAAGGKLLGRTISVVALPALLGPILGPVLGGVILTSLDWRWMFWVNVPFCVVGFLLALRYLEPDGPSSRARLDVVGLALLSPGVAVVIYGLSRVAGDSGFLTPDVLVPLGIGAALVGAFAVWTVRRTDALVDIRLLARRQIWSSTSILFLSGFALYGAMLLLPLYYQDVRGFDALGAGLMIVPQGIGSLFSRSLAGRLTDGVGARWVAVAGFLIIAISTVPFAMAGNARNDVVLVTALLVRGFGLGAVTVPVMAVSFLGLHGSDIAHSSILTRLSQQLGGSFGTAVLAVVLAGAIAHQRQPGTAGLADAFGVAFWWSVGFAIVAAILCLALPARERVSLAE